MVCRCEADGFLCARFCWHSQIFMSDSYFSTCHRMFTSWSFALEPPLMRPLYEKKGKHHPKKHVTNTPSDFPQDFWWVMNSKHFEIRHRKEKHFTNCKKQFIETNILRGVPWGSTSPSWLRGSPLPAPPQPSCLGSSLRSWALEKNAWAVQHKLTNVWTKLHSDYDNIFIIKKNQIACPCWGVGLTNSV